MSVYDTFGDDSGELGIQLKAGDVTGSYYGVGDKATWNQRISEDETETFGYADGVYISYEGIVVIRDGEVTLVDDLPVFDKWGSKLDIKQFLDSHRPVVKVMNEVMNRLETNS